MKPQLVSGNEALALGALRAGVRMVTGYPGTPSTRALASLLAMNLPGRHVEWSTNEKVALEVATGAAWAGQRALCTMKMSGLNVAFDSLVSIAYSGVNGGLVIYVADDPGTSAGMVEQDSRGFARMADLPMLEPASPAEAYRLVQVAFDLSEQVHTPVFLRMVTAVANSRAVAEVGEPQPPPQRTPLLDRDVTRYTKAGSAICMEQHRQLIARLEDAADAIHQLGLNQLVLAPEAGGLGILAGGLTAACLDEAFDLLAGLGIDRRRVSVLKIASTHPFPRQEARQILAHCSVLLVLEELEPYIEQDLVVEAYQLGVHPRIVGKRDGAFSRVGEVSVRQVAQGIARALGLELPAGFLSVDQEAEKLAAGRPITVCAGCPHRGTFLAINQALRRLHYRKNEVMVTGDIGCTILGMNPPFETVWNEIAMGASVALAQGFALSGVKTPVIATMGDSTFFHAGIPGLVNVIQHQVPLTLIIMDNGWTAMTGMQANAGTAPCFQTGDNQRVDIASIVPALGVEQFFVMDPFDLEASTATVQNALQLPGVKVILSRRECAIQSGRRSERLGTAEAPGLGLGRPPEMRDLSPA